MHPQGDNLRSRQLSDQKFGSFSMMPLRSHPEAQPLSNPLTTSNLVNILGRHSTQSSSAQHKLEDGSIVRVDTTSKSVLAAPLAATFGPGRSNAIDSVFSKKFEARQPHPREIAVKRQRSAIGQRLGIANDGSSEKGASSKPAMQDATEASAALANDLEDVHGLRRRLAEAEKRMSELNLELTHTRQLQNTIAGSLIPNTLSKGTASKEQMMNLQAPTAESTKTGTPAEHPEPMRSDSGTRHEAHLGLNSLYSSGSTLPISNIQNQWTVSSKAAASTVALPLTSSNDSFNEIYGSFKGRLRTDTDDVVGGDHTLHFLSQAPMLKPTTHDTASPPRGYVPHEPVPQCSSRASFLTNATNSSVREHTLQSPHLQNHPQISPRLDSTLWSVAPQAFIAGFERPGVIQDGTPPATNVLGDTPPWPLIAYQGVPTFAWSTGLGHYQHGSNWNHIDQDVSVEQRRAACEPTSSYCSEGTEPLNYRRLLDRNAGCNWALLVEKIVCSNDQQASIFMQQKLKNATAEHKFEIVQAIIDQAFPLMVNRFGNFLVQRCFEHGTEEQIIMIAEAICGRTLQLSKDAFGCHVIQKAFDHVPESYKVLMIHELLRQIPETVVHRYACHVWQKLLELRWNDSPPQIMKYVNEALDGMWHEVALGETGSLVVQNIFENCLEEDKRPCVDAVLNNIDVVARGQFGNWCIQHVVEYGSPNDKVHAVDRVLLQASSYSMDQYASKVVEKCLKVGGDDFVRQYLQRTSEPQSDRPRIPLIDIAGDQFGNYLIQWILLNGDNQDRELVASHVRKHMVSLRGSKYGSRVAMLCNNPTSAIRPGPPAGMGYRTSNFNLGNIQNVSGLAGRFGYSNFRQ